MSFVESKPCKWPGCPHTDATDEDLCYGHWMATKTAKELEAARADILKARAEIAADRERLAAAVATVCAQEIDSMQRPAGIRALAWEHHTALERARNVVRALAAKPAELLERAEAVAKEKP